MSTEQKNVVIATYTVEECFKIPIGIDLTNKDQVKNWWIKYNYLQIELTDGKRLEVNAQGWVNNCDYKYPDDSTIFDAAIYSLEDDEDWEYFDCQTGEPTK